MIKCESKIEAAAFRGLIMHLQKRTDVQNIDVMNLAGFCRNCLSKWYLAAADDRGLEMDYDEAREVVYGMSYEEWKIHIRPRRQMSKKLNMRRQNLCMRRLVNARKQIIIS